MPIETVTSADGTRIAHRVVGEGPGVVLVHGAMQSSGSFSELARELSASFRVYVPDRRGRGRSGPQRADHGVDTEVEDLKALLEHSGARFVFGLSSGALIALCAAQAGAPIDRLAVYEPPFTIGDTNPTAWVPRYEREIAKHAQVRAMVTLLKGTADRDLVSRLPRAVLVPIAAVLLRVDAALAKDGVTPMRDLVPTVRFDARIQREATTRLDRITEMRQPLLLMGGDRSHVALRKSLDAFAARMPHAERVELTGVGHIAADDTGRPNDVARELARFFRR